MAWTLQDIHAARTVVPVALVATEVIPQVDKEVAMEDSFK